MWLKNFMHSLVKRPSTMYKTLPRWTNYCYSWILFVIFYLKDCSQLEEAEVPYYMKNAFASGSSKSQMLWVRFQLLSSKCFCFHIPAAKWPFNHHVKQPPVELKTLVLLYYSLNDALFSLQLLANLLETWCSWNWVKYNKALDFFKELEDFKKLLQFFQAYSAVLFVSC